MKLALIVGGAVVVIAVGLWLLFGPARKIAVSSLSINVGKGQSITLTATLMSKGWFGDLAPTAGTIALNSESMVSIDPLRVTTTETAPDASFEVTGVVMGTGKLIMNGSSSGKAHRAVEIPLIVNRGT